ncbi:hypothetical protein [Acetomicrobium sp.]|uniref:hypothetical protein n=1 Tax=Acetomicrobium sp. TaxID=1872099 RepID=UPI00235B66EA|nr:hypothetical protein [Acetomicrobium sp.]
MSCLRCREKEGFAEGFYGDSQQCNGIPKEAFVVLINENPHKNVGGASLADREKGCEEAPEEKLKIGGCRRKNRSLVRSVKTLTL